MLIAVSLCVWSVTTHDMHMTRHCPSVGLYQWLATVSICYSSCL